MPDDDISHEHDLYGSGLLGEALSPKRAGNLAERFLIPSPMRQEILRQTRPFAEAPTIIYGVSDPTTNEIRYVGKTCQTLPTRALSHVYSKGKSHRSRWFQKLKREGLIPNFFILQELAVGEDWVEAEQFWIAYFIFLGAKLINESQGGDGPNGLVRSEATRAKMRANALIIFNRPDVKAASKAVKQSLSHRKKMQEVALVVQNMPEVKEKHVEKALKQHANPDARRRHGASVKKALSNPEIRIKMFRSNREIGVLVPVLVHTSQHHIILSVLQGGRTLDDIADECDLTIAKTAHRLYYVLTVKHGIGHIYKEDGTFELILPPGKTYNDLIRTRRSLKV